MSAVTLNPQQRAAVHAEDGPALVLAGAGSGKTRVIVERIVYLIDECGIDPRFVLALTFTNRAAEEMRQRIMARLEVDRLSSWVGTFHSFALFILRREMDALGRSKSFTMFDDTDQISLIKRLIKELPERYEKVSPREALHWISRYKQDLTEPGDEPEDADDPEEEAYRELWTRYHNALASASAVDFDDLLVLVARLFQEHPEVRDRYRRRFRHVLVDEYQDTNHAQYVIARELTGEGGNLFVVGDEDQSIYSWRGADIENILNFEKDFPGAQVFRLEQNYRSTAPILNAANAVVANNVHRLGKKLWTEASGGEAVQFYLADEGAEEASYILDSIKKRDLRPGDVAILFRTNGQARQIEEVCLRKGVAYNVVGGVRFYARKEIKDVLCYLRLLVNPADDEAARRVLNVPPRGVGAVTLQKLNERAATTGQSLLETLRSAIDEGLVSGKASSGISAFLDVIDALTVESQESDIEPLVETLLEQTDYREFLRISDEKDFRTRLEVVEEFLSACGQFDERHGGTLMDFLQDLSLMSDTDDLDPGAPQLKLLTCHAAKGLEFDHVYLVGMEEGFLPHGSAMDDEEDVEEERRLCYVAMTRARKSLTLTAALSRLVYGERRDRQTSRFIDEIPPEHLVRVGGAAPSKRGKPAAQAARAAGGALKMGTRVRHAKFGSGVVMYTSGSGAKLKARIRFDSGVSRQFMVSAAPLEILEGKKR